MPERTCLFCRSKSEKSELLRFVLASGSLMWDRYNKMPGRGVYIGGDCLDKGIPPEKVWRRALRIEAAVIDALQIKGLLKEVLKEIQNEQNQNL